MGEVADLRSWKAPGEAKDTEPRSFESFFEEQKERLLRILSVITGSRAEAEDLAQEAFTKVFERWDTVAAMEDPPADAGARWHRSLSGGRRVRLFEHELRSSC